MAIDAYSLCPGGTGKKIKFCCDELLPDLQKLDRMIEGQQFQGALSHVDLLLEKNPDRECLLSIKIQLLRAVERVEDAIETAKLFIDKHPENPVALAESAMLTAMLEGGVAAVEDVQKSLAASKDQMYSQVYEAIGMVAQSLLSEGEFRAGRALLQLQVIVSRDDEKPMAMLSQLNRSAAIPVLLRDDPILETCPDDVPWKQKFDEAMVPVQRGQWFIGEAKLTALLEEVPDSPVIWKNLATLRGWLADAQGSTEALQKYAEMDVPLEDAVEARTTAILLSDDPLGDHIDVSSLNYGVADVEKLQEAFAIAKTRVMQVPAGQTPKGEGVPPKAVYLLLSCEEAKDADDLTLDNIPCAMAQILLYGKQTDKEARLEVIGVTATNYAATKESLKELAGDTLGDVVDEEVITQVSASREMLERPWRLPNDVSREKLDELIKEHQEDVLLKRWLEMPFGLFDGRTAKDVADDGAYRVRLLAAILLMRGWSEQAGDRFDFNLVRSRLGLPTLEKIELKKDELLEYVPLIRLDRVVVEDLTDEQAFVGFRRAMVFGMTDVVHSFAKVVADRPKFEGTNEQLQAFTILARLEEDNDEAMKYIERGRKVSTSAGHSDAQWDMLELPLRLRRGESQEAGRVIEHLQSAHMQEPGIADALTQLMMQLGAIQPDAMRQQTQPVQEDATEPGGLWTPDGSQSGGGGDKPKIWTPDMD